MIAFRESSSTVADIHGIESLRRGVRPRCALPMACYRSLFAAGRVFEVVIDRASVAGDTTLCSAAIFRVTEARLKCEM